jgi:hypothetical protein
VVPVIDHAGMPGMKARLVEKQIEAASPLGTSKLVVLDPLDDPVEAAVRLLLRGGGVDIAPLDHRTGAGVSLLAISSESPTIQTWADLAV